MSERTNLAYCAGCDCMQPVDRHWLSLYIDAKGYFLSAPFVEMQRFVDAPLEAVIVCGQTPALALYERYLHARTFAAPNLSNAQPLSNDGAPTNTFQENSL